ncbi:MAG: 6-carboxytetrahydropterin synthase QueD [bacterium]|nr:6-carboxytetrahydropterin synthase QueD [bacterium]MDD5756905.1 6-carboxytetrahydropterin synthase QueD [bacterium]
MFTLKVIKVFSAAHNLREYKGKCEKLHGHNWKVEVEVQGKKLGRSGMLIDFHDLKKKVEDALAKLDHGYLNESAPFDKINPTSENLAKYIFASLNRHLPSAVCRLSKITVWESDTACATYKE